MSVFKKIFRWTTVLVIVALAVFCYIKFYFKFGEGVKAGELNQIMYKGWIWKTYEGRLIQSGFKGAKTGGSIQSNEFDFSVVSKSIADSLMRCSGKVVELHYVEYRGALPWRGMQKYIVDGIISIQDGTPAVNTIPIVPTEEI